ncbi:Uncharacterized conserved protein YgbK, DUF1537 family [Rhizobium mongolense subsp. loessense]|uniref:3-oxo-tetronate kinase n=1 Tax=Rhizobium mongolense subsp. loessense TaxID=158890 RepID=A0A1G4R3F6_9HYPH|nr:3-oxo-tetronate kinase [Rhizobium mongolense]SCW50719.1 Uncharacterized conserved protein YgbK, DUF1537 family [Rhizobium mongolense subsp. loessense]
MLLGVIADDFTGASDIANTIAKGIAGEGGLRTAQFLGVPKGPAPSDIEGGVIALKSRSIPATEAIEQSLAALEWLQAQGCSQIVFKYCSTFDSTPEGNIGPVGEALADALRVKGVVACSAFPGAGRTIYQGHLFVKDRLLNESGLEHHPLNPMTDADLRRWLKLQTKSAVGHVAWNKVTQGATAVREDLKRAATAGDTLVIVDAVSDADLIAIGEALSEAPLVTGGSGIAIGLPRNFIARGLAKGSSAMTSSVSGPEAILAGSCSGATRGQVDLHKVNHPTLAIDVDKVMAGDTTSRDVVEFIVANHGKKPLAYSSGSPDEVSRLQERYGRDKVAHTLDKLFADTARELVTRGVRRLVVAGGETSGAVVSALDLGALAIGPEIDPGVPVVVSGGSHPIALALKSGNFGAPDFFSKALGRLEGK